MTVADRFTQFDYLLNALEAASQTDAPAEHGYGEKRRKLYEHVRELERKAAAYDAAGVLVGGDWLPTAENINALPEPLRLYIAGLETLCDPAGIVRENTLLKDSNKGLQAMYRKAVDAGVAPTGEGQQ